MTTQAQTPVEELLRTHKVLLDASFAMDAGFRPFVLRHRAALRGQLIVPEVVVRELHGLAHNDDPARREAAQSALTLVENLERLGELEVRGESSDHAADLVIQRVVLQHWLTYDWLVLTNDRDLAQDLAELQSKRSVQSNRSLCIVRLDARGHPVRYIPPASTLKPETPSATKPAGQPRSAARPSRRAASPGPAQAPGVSAPQATTETPGPPRAGGPPVTPFALTARVTPGQEQCLMAETALRSGSRVFLPEGPALVLGERIAAGGEAAIYAVEGTQERVCKIYSPAKLTVGRRDKVRLMLTRRVDRPALCWPQAVVQDGSGLFRGYLMSRATGAPLGETLFIPEEFLEAHPAWTRRESVRLALTILEEIQYLHRLNVLIGDLNPQNLLLSGPETVQFVDCDSFQVEGYPCPVGMPTFLAPELHGQRLEAVLRTTDQELFAVATLLFMILLPGKPPYSHAGGGEGGANVRERKFPYTRNYLENERKAPSGPWTLCWSHLSRPLKDAFYHSFSDRAAARSRVTIREWIELLEHYASILERPGGVFHGPKQQVGYDLSILPQNRRYTEYQSRPIPQDGKTDCQRMLDWLMGQVRTVWPV